MFAVLCKENFEGEKEFTVMELATALKVIQANNRQSMFTYLVGQHPSLEVAEGIMCRLSVKESQRLMDAKCQEEFEERCVRVAFIPLTGLVER